MAHTEEENKEEVYNVRRLKIEDLDDMYFALLTELTSAPYPDTHALHDMFAFVQANTHTYTILVIEERSTKDIVGTGTLVIERKFIRNLGKVGHIEDIAIAKSKQGLGLGKILIEHIISYAKQEGCYKTILACSTDNVGFYEKCGFKQKEIEMAIYHNE